MKVYVQWNYRHVQNGRIVIFELRVCIITALNSTVIPIIHAVGNDLTDIISRKSMRIMKKWSIPPDQYIYVMMIYIHCSKRYRPNPRTWGSRYVHLTLPLPSSQCEGHFLSPDSLANGVFLAKTPFKKQWYIFLLKSLAKGRPYIFKKKTNKLAFWGLNYRLFSENFSYQPLQRRPYRGPFL